MGCDGPSEGCAAGSGEVSREHLVRGRRGKGRFRVTVRARLGLGRARVRGRARREV